MTVTTGKAGYYRREDASEKQVEQKAVVYENELEINPDAADNMFKMAVRQTQAPASAEAFDGSTLPFFNASRIRNSVMNTSSAASDVAMSGAESVAPETKPGPGGDAESDQDSDNENSSLQLQSYAEKLSFAAPKGKAKATPKPEAKASAAKPKANPKTKPKPDRKRKQDEMVLTLDDIKKAQKTNTQDADKKIVEPFSATLSQLRQDAFVCNLDTEVALNECLKTASKTLASNKSLCTQKIKSLNRRKEGSADFVVSEIDAIQNEYSAALKVCNGLLSCSGEDLSLLDQMADLSDWSFSPSLYKRGLKCACISNLKFTDWNAFTCDTKHRVDKILGPSDGEPFFWIMVNELVQKLLRGVSLKKVSWTNLQSLFCLSLSFLF